MTNRTIICAQYDAAMEVEKWFTALPFLRFPSSWEVKIIPPMVGAVIRFRVRRVGAAMPDLCDGISIYFDGYHALGHCGHDTGYWEIYPDKQGENARFLPGEEMQMMAEIDAALDVWDLKEGIAARDRHGTPIAWEEP